MKTNLVLLTALLFLVSRCPSSNVKEMDFYSEYIIIDIDAQSEDNFEINEIYDSDISLDKKDYEENKEEVLTPPVVKCYFITSKGIVGKNEDTVSLFKEDEPLKYTDSVGFQVDIGVQVTGAKTGDPSYLYIKGSKVKEQAITVDPQTHVANFAFEDVTLDHSLSGYEIVVEVVNDAGLKGSCTKFVKVDTGLCSVELFPVTEQNSQCVFKDDDPEQSGFQKKFKVINKSLDCKKAYVVYQIGPGNEVKSDEVNFDENGEAVIELTLSSEDTGINGKEVSVTGYATDPDHPEKTNKTNPYIMYLDTEKPSVQITYPDVENLSLENDKDGNSDNGVQVDIIGTVSGLNPLMKGNSVALFINGLKTDEIASTDQQFIFQDITFSQDGNYTIEVKAQDACGFQGSASTQVNVYTLIPIVSIVSPQDGETLFAKNDEDITTPDVYDGKFTVAIASYKEGFNLKVLCKQKDAVGAYQDVSDGGLLVETKSSNNQYEVPVKIDIKTLSNQVVCKVTYSYPNFSESDSVNLIVGLPAPSVQIQTPQDGDILNTTVLKINGSATNLNDQQLNLTIKNKVTNEVVYTENGFATVEDDGFYYQNDLKGVLSDGAYILSVDGTDKFGNKISEQKGVKNFVDFSVDTTPPVIQLSSPASDSIDSQTVPDENPEENGYQTTFVFSIQNENILNGVKVCMAVDGGSYQCETNLLETPEIKFKDVTLIPGENTIKFYGVDVAGNTSDEVIIKKTLVSPLPRVEITTPPEDTFTAAVNYEIVVSVSDSTNGNPINDANLSLYKNGVKVSTLNSGNDGNYKFNVTLDSGENKFYAIAIYNNQTSYSNVRIINKKDSVPSVVFTEPENNQVLNTKSTICAPGVKDCILDVKATVTNAENGSFGELTVLCNGNSASYNSEVVDGEVIFDEVVLTDQNTCTLTIKIVDLAEQTVYSEPISVTIDRIAPVIYSINLPAYMNYIYDDDKSKEGMQKNVKVVLSGIEASQNVKLVLIDESFKTYEYNHQVTENIPDSVKKEIEFGKIDIPEGNVSVSVTTSDKAGNPAQEFKKNIFVASYEPVVRIIDPPFVEDKSCNFDEECDAGGICFNGKCVIPWNSLSVKEITVVTKSIPYGEGLTNNLRICSNNPQAADITGEPCAKEGYYVVKYATIQDTQITKVNVSNLNDGEHKIIAEALLSEGNNEWLNSIDSGIDKQRYRTVYIDTVPPVVTDLSIPTDVSEPYMILSKSEIGDAGVYEVKVTGEEPGVFGIIINQTQTLEKETTEKFAVFTLESSEGVKQIQAYLIDKFQNKSTLYPDTPLTLTIDTIPPDIKFVYPAKPIVLANDSSDVIITSEEPGVTVQLFNDGTKIGEKLIDTSLKAVFNDVLVDDGEYNLTAKGFDSALNENDVKTTPQTVVVDRTVPEVTILKPVSGSSLSDTDDVESAPGFQLEVEFQISKASKWNISLATGCNDTFTECSEPTVVASGDLSDEGSYTVKKIITLKGSSTKNYKVIVSGIDSSGNETVSESTFTINITGCYVEFMNLPESGYINTEYCTPQFETCDSANFNLKVSYIGDCPDASEISLYVNGEVFDTKPLTNGEALFILPVSADDNSIVLKAVLLDAVNSKISESSEETVGVDLITPDVNFIEAVVEGFKTPKTGDNVLYGISDDLDKSTPDTCEIHCQIFAQDNNLIGGKILKLERGINNVFEEINAGLPVSIDENTFPYTFKFVSLLDGQEQVIRVTVEDEAGNIDIATFVATVDLTPPAPIMLNDITDVDTNKRRPSIRLRWYAVGDNGEESGTKAQSYDIRFSYSPIETDEDFEKACKVSNITSSKPFPEPGVKGTLESYSVTGPDVRSPDTEENGQPCKFVVKGGGTTVYFAVKAKDKAGNWSAIDPSGVVSTSKLNLSYSKVIFSGDMKDTDTVLGVGKYTYYLGDVNNDGKGDIGARIKLADNTYKFCIITGREDVSSDYTISSDSGTNHFCFGTDIYDDIDQASPMGFRSSYLGDINGDGIDDFIVGVGNPEMALVFLGENGTIPQSPSLIIKGQTNYSAPYLVGSLTSFVGDFDGDGLNDIGVSSIIENSFYIISGSSSLSSDNPVVVIDLTDSQTYGNFKIAKIKMQTADTVQFGLITGGVGNIFADDGVVQYDEVGIFQLKNPAQVVIVKGRALEAGLNEILLSPAIDGSHPEDANTFRIQPEKGVTSYTFGYQILGGFDLNNGGVPDIVIQHGRQAMEHPELPYGIYVIYGEKIKDMLGQVIKGVSLSETSPVIGNTVHVGKYGVIIEGAYDNIVLAGNFDDESVEFSSVDLAMGKFSYTEWGEVTIRLNLKNDTENIFYGYYPYSDIKIKSPFELDTPNYFGNNVVYGGDFNGDGFSDLFVGVKNESYIILIY